MPTAPQGAACLHACIGLIAISHFETSDEAQPAQRMKLMHGSIIAARAPVRPAMTGDAPQEQVLAAPQVSMVGVQLPVLKENGHDRVVECRQMLEDKSDGYSDSGLPCCLVEGARECQWSHSDPDLASCQLGDVLTLVAGGRCSDVARQDTTRAECAGCVAPRFRTSGSANSRSDRVFLANFAACGHRVGSYC